VKKILFTYCLFFSFFAQSQSCSKVLVVGNVMDSLNYPSYYNFMLVNRRTGQGSFGMANGKFSIYALNNDTISISAKGYDLTRFVIKADSNCQSKQIVGIYPKARIIGEVTIRPLKSLEQIKEEREALVMRDTRTVTGLNVFQSPITALYERFSKRSKSIAMSSELKYKDQKAQLLQELLRVYVSYEIIDLDEEEFDQFITFLNINEEFLKTATEYELVTYISDKFEHYLRTNEPKKYTFEKSKKP
jgi:hypothetical protein